MFAKKKGGVKKPAKGGKKKKKKKKTQKKKKQGEKGKEGASCHGDHLADEAKKTVTTLPKKKVLEAG